MAFDPVISNQWSNGLPSDPPRGPSVKTPYLPETTYSKDIHESLFVIFNKEHFCVEFDTIPSHSQGLMLVRLRAYELGYL